MTSYIALLRRDEGSDYGVDFPDFPGCVTAGATWEEARRLADEALPFHIEGIVEDGEPIPQPSSLQDVMVDQHNSNAVAFLVTITVAPTGTTRIDVRLLEDLLAAIDRATTDRSRFLADAARMKLQAVA